MRVVKKSAAKVAAEEVKGAKGVKIRWLISDKDGAPTFAMRLLEVMPGTATPYHSHDWEHEVYILEGTCEVVEENSATLCKKGDVVFVPPNIAHQFKNAGKEVLKFICVIPKEGCKTR